LEFYPLSLLLLVTSSASILAAPQYPELRHMYTLKEPSQGKNFIDTENAAMLYIAKKKDFNMTAKKIRLILWFSLILIISLLPFFIHSQQRHPATVLKISDGDTIWVSMNRQKIKLRLIGIDTPEKFSSKKLEREAAECQVSPGYMKNLGQLATAYAKRLLHKGQKVKVVIYGYGYYGRALAMIYLPDGTCYNERIVRDGYACVYERSEELPEEIMEKLLSLEEQARRERRGLWGTHYRVMKCLCE